MNESIIETFPESEVLTEVKSEQVRISFSIDDFGTGYSSLNYLNRLPVDELKIDQTFVKDVSALPDHAIIVDTIIVMAQQLNLKIVAEGIETVEELDYLKSHQCKYFQGYFFSRPVPFDQFSRSIG